MARPSTEIIRARLTIAADDLRNAGKTESAEAVEQILAPRGWELLKPPAQSSPGALRNLTMPMATTERDRLKQAVEDAGRTIADDVNEGFRRYLDGKFTPDQPQRARRNTFTEKANLNTRPDADLRKQVEEKGKADAEQLGWKPTPAIVGAAWLRHKYPAK